ncbi:HlyD family type I secretion periplasmic adaptor subunit [Pseudomonas sp. GD03651]|jgi:membrane fusion protein, epimerase transport system|uniref:Membrane fusion protein (MFP) family protein n=1 Tax=Pseudomonas putida TaxID=303 RepID=A0A1L7N9D2_PSEPU|nr:MULTISPECIES: HlyD family type I secretion periplasmic adaptor subunit [Pseudomonas]AGN81459.1 hemolysin secretion protein D [Pseudomonas putida H8234]EKT4562240.1 HlyD family type I secretion periplasmic adaptor subunit [Pseudomonas putida]MCE0967573.1 HlyD family type I secretion periplasmic adaptor subunit [Pseudomonas sp. NMI4491_12]MDH2186024.1 HlyD family type I secretion periplasmic adaptor subunit [Pseudomonas sp. GD03651]MDP9540281.1 HlyD family type I secretion periplasmic adaptor
MSSKAITTFDHNFDDMPTSDRGIRRFGLTVVFITFGVFGTWAAFAPLSSAVHGTGVVTVQNYRKTVQHLEGGIVKELHARDGDLVKKGDPLIVLDESQLSAEYESTRNQLIVARYKEARLRAERDGLPSIPPVTMEGTDSDRAQEALAGEEQVFKARHDSLQGEISVNRERIQQMKQQIAGLNDMIRTKAGLNKSYSGEIKQLKELLAEGFVDNQRLLEQERKLDMLKTDIADHESNITKTKLQIGETELQIVQLKKKFDADVAKELSDVQAQVFDLQEKEAALRDRLSRVVIRAPESGMVLDMKVHTIGGVVSAATPLLDIVPAQSELVVEAKVDTRDIDRLELGKTADVRFSAFNQATTPVIEGKLTRISADSLVDERSGDQYYLVRVKVTEDGMKKLANRKLQPGMPAEVLINAGDRTMLQYLLKPARNLFAESLIEE